MFRLVGEGTPTNADNDFPSFPSKARPSSPPSSSSSWSSSAFAKCPKMVIFSPFFFSLASKCHHLMRPDIMFRKSATLAKKLVFQKHHASPPKAPPRRRPATLCRLLFDFFFQPAEDVVPSSNKALGDQLLAGWLVVGEGHLFCRYCRRCGHVSVRKLKAEAVAAVAHVQPARRVPLTKLWILAGVFFPSLFDPLEEKPENSSETICGKKIVASEK